MNIGRKISRIRELRGMKKAKMAIETGKKLLEKVAEEKITQGKNSRTL